MTQDERVERYRAGKCIDCGQKWYSAGRVRCNECHQIHMRDTTGRRD